MGYKKISPDGLVFFLWMHGGLTLNKSMSFQASINADNNVNSNNRQDLAFFAAGLFISKLLFLLSLSKQYLFPGRVFKHLV